MGVEQGPPKLGLTDSHHHKRPQSKMSPKSKRWTEKSKMTQAASDHLIPQDQSSLTRLTPRPIRQEGGQSFRFSVDIRTA